MRRQLVSVVAGYAVAALVFAVALWLGTGENLFMGTERVPLGRSVAPVAIILFAPLVTFVVAMREGFGSYAHFLALFVASWLVGYLLCRRLIVQRADTAA